MKDFLTFKKMITPIIIQIMFWIGVIICILTGIMSIGSGIRGEGDGTMMVIIGLGTLLIGPVLIRIYCELVIVFFSINNTLTDTKNLLQQQAGE